jgi:hypothetical protein
MLARHAGSFLVVELTEGNAEALVERLARLSREHPLARAVVVADRGLAEYELWVREAGAAWFETSPRNLTGVAAMARRHLDSIPGPTRSLTEEVWANLPWGKPDRH